MSDELLPKPRRRTRYRGTHPRRFEEKYKEHNPERYAGDVARILASGKTPAGSHRPILVQEVLRVLDPKPGETGVDATLGYGGHAAELLSRIQPAGKLLALDVDPAELPRTEERLRARGFDAGTLIVKRSNFAGLPRMLAESGLGPVDFILADLGLSSMQIDNPTRGFTFKREGPFDLRMNPERGQPAWVYLQKLSRERLVTLLEENGDEPAAARIAAALLEPEARDQLRTTTGVADVIRRALNGTVGTRGRTDASDAAIRRVFQAVRIAVNDEFSALDTFLRNLPQCLKPGGRVAVLTFHSGEDRRVKKAFLNGADVGVYSSVADEVIRPSPEEMRSNPRASPAKLRWAIRSTLEGNPLERGEPEQA